MRPKLYEHVGFLGVFLEDPGIRFSFYLDDVLIGVFGCYWCTEQELEDFVLLRAAVLMGCGRFDSRLQHVRVVVEAEKSWTYEYRHAELKFCLKNDN